LSGWAGGYLLGGIFICFIGASSVLVPQDVGYLNLSSSALDPKLLNFIAHDRISFGATMLAIGAAVLGSIWCGTRPGTPRLLLLFAAVCLIELITAVGVHFLIGYIDAVHLLPFIVKDLLFLIGGSYLYVPLFCSSVSARNFPDL
jgi:hypothetical protein